MSDVFLWPEYQIFFWEMVYQYFLLVTFVSSVVSRWLINNKCFKVYLGGMNLLVSMKVTSTLLVVVVTSFKEIMLLIDKVKIIACSLDPQR